MKVIESNIKDEFVITGIMVGADVQMHKIDGEVIKPTGYLIYEDVSKDTGEVKTFLALVDENEKTYVSGSQTILDSWNSIFSQFKDVKKFAVKVRSSKSNNDRDFYQLVPVRR